MMQKQGCNKIPALKSFVKKMPSFLNFNTDTSRNAYELTVLFVVNSILFSLKETSSLPSSGKRYVSDVFSKDTLLSTPVLNLDVSSKFLCNITLLASARH